MVKTRRQIPRCLGTSGPFGTQQQQQLDNGINFSLFSHHLTSDGQSPTSHSGSPAHCLLESLSSSHRGIVSVNHFTRIVGEKGKKFVSSQPHRTPSLHASVLFLLKELVGTDKFPNLPCPRGKRKNKCRKLLSPHWSGGPAKDWFLISYRNRSLWFEICSLLILSCSLCTTLFTTKGTVVAIYDCCPCVPQRASHLFVFFLGQLRIHCWAPLERWAEGPSPGAAPTAACSSLSLIISGSSK